MIEVRTAYIEALIYQQAKSGNQESGDAYFTHSEEDYFIFAIADGLGNGPMAQQSAAIIPKVLKEHHDETIEELLNRCNEFMIQKRGAAVAIVKVDFKKQTIQYSCVGNVRLYILQYTGKMVYPLPVSGYLSGRRLKLRTQTYPYQPGDIFFLHSDGVELRSPSSLLKNANGIHDIYHTVIEASIVNDDATFITGNLLR